MKLRVGLINIVSLTLAVSTVMTWEPAFAEEKSLGSKIVDKVGSAVGGTVEGVGKTVSGIGRAVTGSEDLMKARSEIDTVADNAITRLTKNSRSAAILYPKSYGYAVFDSRKFSAFLTAGSGIGVVVEKSNQNRTYMRMATAGAGLGFGAQFFQVVFLFEDKASLERFINQGWEANAAASAVFGEDSLERNVRFVEGMAVFQMNEAGIMADLNITGTKYWRSDELNQTS